MIGCDPQTVSNYIADGTLIGRKSGKGIVMVSTATIRNGTEKFRRTKSMGRTKKREDSSMGFSIAVQWNDDDCIMNRNVCIPQYYVTLLRETDEDDIQDIMVALEEADKPFDNIEIHTFDTIKEYTAYINVYKALSALFISRKSIFNK